MLKKILLSGFVLVSFVVYSFHQRHEEVSQVIAPSSAGTTTGPQTPVAAGQGTQTIQSGQTGSQYKDGSFTGSLADAYYGYIQVLAIISGGKLTDVRFLQYPNDRSNSIEINRQAMPYLKQEALQAQTANVDIISGATDTSYAFRESLSSALSGAKY